MGGGAAGEKEPARSARVRLVRRLRERWPPRMSLRRKLLLGVSILLLPVTLLVIADVRGDLAARRGLAEERQLELARAVASVVETMFDDAIMLGLLVASDPAVRTLEPERVQEALQEIAYLHPRFLTDIDVLDASGEPLGTTRLGTPAEPRLPPERAPGFREALDAKVPVITPVVPAGVRAERTVTFVVVPILQGDAAPAAVVLSISGAAPPPRLAQLQLPAGITYLVLDPRGRVAFESKPDSLDWAERDLSHLHSVRQAMRGERVARQDHALPGARPGTNHALVRTARFGWLVVVFVPGAELALFREAVRHELLALVVLAAVALGGTLVLSRLLVEPLGALARAARRLAAGELAARADVRTGDEIEELCSNFNQMAESLQGTIGELRRTSSRLEAIVDSMSEAVFGVSQEGRLLEANGAALRRFGLTRDALGEHVSTYLERFRLRFTDGRPVTYPETATRRALLGEEGTSYEGIYTNPRGEDRRVVVTSRAALDREGRPLLAVTMMRDVTDERRLERQRLSLARVAQRIAASRSVDEAVTVTVDELVRSFDARLARIWVWAEAEQALILRASAGASTRTATTGSAFGRIRPGELKVGKVAQQRTPYWSNRVLDEPWLRDPAWARRERVVSFAGLPLQAGDRLVGVMGFFGLRALEESDRMALATLADHLALAVQNAELVARLRVALHLRDEFVTAASHELRNPITAMRMHLARLRGAVGGALAGREEAELALGAVGATERSLDRIARLADDLATSAELEAPGAPIPFEPVDLASVVGSITDALRERAPRHPLRVDVEPVQVTGNRDLLAKLVRHLIEYVERYEPPTGEIVVQVRRAARDALLSVRGSRLVISPERQPYVFEPLYDPVPPGAEGYVGVVGLGLGISRQIVEHHRGRIWVESRPGEGTAFRVALPLAAAGETGTRPSAAA